MTRDDSDPIVLAAAAWRARHDAGLDAVGERELLHWLESDERHAAAFAELGAAWTALDRLRELPTAALGLPADSPAALPAARATRAPRRRWLVATAATVALAAALALAWIPFAQRPAAPADTAVVTAAGFKRLDLPDGTVVRLNAGAALAVDYTAATRAVRLLRGEAHFTVVRDPARPFTVEARGIQARALGTAFTVAHEPGSVAVLVTEGRVQVEGSHVRDLPALAAGERVRVALAAPAAAVTPTRLSAAELDAAVAWQRQLLAFDRAPLAEIVAAFNRCNQRQIVVDDPALARRHFGGSFRADDPEGFVALVAATADVTTVREGELLRLRATR